MFIVIFNGIIVTKITTDRSHIGTFVNNTLQTIFFYPC